MDKRLRLGISELKPPLSYQYDNILLSTDGRYCIGLSRLVSFFEKDRANWGEKEWHFVLRVIHECEEARRWRALDIDAPTARVQYFDAAAEGFELACKAVKQLRALDRRHPYLLRHSFAEALERLVPTPTDMDVQAPNPNHPDGGSTYQADAATKFAIQHQLVRQIGLFGFQDLLNEFESSLRSRKRLPAPYSQIACLRVDPPHSRRAIRRVRADVAGLAAWLSYLMREWTAGRGVNPTWPGILMSTDGRPCWDIVADFVNAALPSDKVQTADTLRQQWHALAKNRTVRLCAWPREPVREAQVA